MKHLYLFKSRRTASHASPLRKLVALYLSFTLTALPTNNLHAASSEETRLQKLEAAVAALQAENVSLKKEVTSLRAKTAEFRPYAGSLPLAPVGSDDKPKPINVVAAGKEYKLVLGGFIQAQLEGGDGAAYQGRWAGSQSGINSRFRLRRARINLTGDFKEKFDFKLEGDFTLNDASSSRTSFSATDVFINWHEHPEANVKAGQFKAPFGLEQLTSDTKMLTIERSLVTEAITLERQLGAQIWGKPLTNFSEPNKDLITYYFGIFNGNGRNTNINDNNEFLLAGRLELLPFKGKLLKQETSLQLGVNGYHSRDNAGVNISPAGNLFVNADGSLSSLTLGSPAERQGIGTDITFQFGRLTLIAEYLAANIRPNSQDNVTQTFNAFDTNGFYVEGAYFLIPKKLQLVTKWEQFNPGQRRFDGIQSFTGGLTYYINGDDLKFMVNYIHTWSDFRKNNPDLELGKDDFSTVLARLQLMF